MSSPKAHKKRIKGLLSNLEAEIDNVYQEHHVEFPIKSIDELKIEINKICEEIERVNLVPKK